MACVILFRNAFDDFMLVVFLRIVTHRNMLSDMIDFAVALSSTGVLTAGGVLVGSIAAAVLLTRLARQS